MGVSQADKWIALPPKTPKEYVQAYRRAFEMVVKNPKFLKLARKQLSVDIIAISGKDMQQLIKDSVDVSKESVAYASKLKKKYGLPQ